MIESAYLWDVIIYLGIGTIIIRGSIIAISKPIKISDRVREVMSFIPAAVLPTLMAPMVFHRDSPW